MSKQQKKKKENIIDSFFPGSEKKSKWNRGSWNAKQNHRNSHKLDTDFGRYQNPINSITSGTQKTIKRGWRQLGKRNI